MNVIHVSKKESNIFIICGYKFFLKTIFFKLEV